MMASLHYLVSLLERLHYKSKILLDRTKWLIRRQPLIAAIAYQSANLFYAAVYKFNFPHSSEEIKKLPDRHNVALCLRFRDEGPYLQEWLEYHIAAGIDHFFLYNNFSSDNYREVLAPYILSGMVTLIDWPFTPASPDAENDCINRTIGHYKWVGFIDADEFVVIKSNITIPEYLAKFPDGTPAVALHWYMFGSNGHKRRPNDLVINSYTKRSSEPNWHFKVFVRPELVTRNRNSHNFYYKHGKRAIREDKSFVYGSMKRPGSAKHAWINHYYCKSYEDYLQKALKKSTLDRSGINTPSRQLKYIDMATQEHNDVIDISAVKYYRSCLLRVQQKM